MYLEKKKNNKKIIITSIIVAIVLIGMVGVTFALWNHFNVGFNQEVVVTGNIYMKYTGANSTITIDDAIPREEYIPDKYFEFTIEGENDYPEDIWYEILLSKGAVPKPKKGKTERIRDDLLLFKLVEVENGEETIIFDRMSYPELNNTSAFVDTIKGKTNNVLKKYRLYMWISPGNEDNIDYDMDTVYGSVKVNVKGDFNEKEKFSCFIGVGKATYNDKRTDEQVNACVNYLTEEFGTEEKVGLEEGETYKEYCEGTGTWDGYTFQEELNDGKAYDLNELQELSEIGIVKDVKFDYSTITGYSEECSKDVVIPSVIDKIKVTAIGNNAFSEKQLTSVNIPSGVTKIGEFAFYKNQLTRVNIPNSVATIGEYAFFENQLTNVNIPNSVATIEGMAFSDNPLINVTIGNGIESIGGDTFFPSYFGIDLDKVLKIAIDKTCDEIEKLDIGGYSKYSWVPDSLPVSITGKNNKVCHTYFY